MDQYSPSTLLSRLGSNRLSSVPFSNYLREKKFNDESQIKMDLLNFFDQKTQDFYESGILSLPERWQQVIDSNGAYILDW